MSPSFDDAAVAVPSSYSDWLECFALIKAGSPVIVDSLTQLEQGTLVCSATTLVAFQNRLVEALNGYLAYCVNRFNRQLQECFLFNDCMQIPLLFARLKKALLFTLFFEQLPFLPESFRAELSKQIRDYISSFWSKEIKSVRKLAIDDSFAELEDVLFLIQRNKLLS